MKTSKMLEVAAQKALIGLDADYHTVEAAPSGRLYTAAVFENPTVYVDPDSLMITGLTSSGEKVSAKLISAVRGEESFESILGQVKKEFFKKVDEEKNESN